MNPNDNSFVEIENSINTSLAPSHSPRRETILKQYSIDAQIELKQYRVNIITHNYIDDTIRTMHLQTIILLFSSTNRRTCSILRISNPSSPIYNRILSLYIWYTIPASSTSETCNCSLSLPPPLYLVLSQCGLCKISERTAGDHDRIPPSTALVDVNGEGEEEDYQQIRTAQFHRQPVMHCRRMFAWQRDESY